MEDVTVLLLCPTCAQERPVDMGRVWATGHEPIIEENPDRPDHLTGVSLVPCGHRFGRYMEAHHSDLGVFVAQVAEPLDVFIQS